MDKEGGGCEPGQKIAGFEVGRDAGRLRNIIALVNRDSTDVEDYRRLLEAAAAADEPRILAANLFEGSLGNTLKGSAAYQTEEQIELCRDDFKTLLLVKVPRLDPDRVARGREERDLFDRTWLDVLPNDAAFLFLGDGTIELKQYSVDPHVDGRRLVSEGVKRYRPGQTMVVRRDVDAFDAFRVSGEVWILQAVVNKHSDLVVHYDRATLERTGASSSNFHATRMEFVMDILRNLPTEGAAEAIEEIYAKSRFYFVRWKAVQTLLRMDLARGAQVLSRALEDEHPHVRGAAARTCQALRQHGHI